MSIALPLTLLAVALPPPGRDAARHAAMRPAQGPAAGSASAASASDDVLVARAIAGDDRSAFAELARRHQSAVRSLLRRLARDDALADDLAQDTFIQVYRNLTQFRGDAKFSTWIYRIAYNAFLAHARSARSDEPLPEDWAEPPAGVETPPSLARASALRIDLERALAALSPNERAAIVHCYYHDLSHEEAAYVLGCPLGTVKTNVLRGKQKLAKLLAAWAPDGGTGRQS